MASPDQNLSTYLQRIRRNNYNIKNMDFIGKIETVMPRKISPFWPHTQSVMRAVGSGSAAFFALKGYYEGLMQLPIWAVTIILAWNAAKPYFSNTKIRKLLDEPLTFVTKKKLDSQNIPVAPIDAVPMGLKANDNYTEPIVKSLADLRSSETSWADQVDKLIASTEFEEAKKINIDKLVMPKPLTFNELMILLKNQKKAEEYFQIKNYPGVYFDLSVESKQNIAEILKQMVSQESQSKAVKFFKENQQYIAGGIGSIAITTVNMNKKSNENKELINRLNKEADNESKTNAKPRTPNPFDVRKKNPKKFGG